MFTIFLFIKSSIKMIVITLTTLMSLVDLALSPSLNWMTSAASTRTSDIILILILLCQPHHPHHPPSYSYLLHQHLHPLHVRITSKSSGLWALTSYWKNACRPNKLVLSKLSKKDTLVLKRYQPTVQKHVLITAFSRHRHHHDHPQQQHDLLIISI